MPVPPCSPGCCRATRPSRPCQPFVAALVPRPRSGGPFYYHALTVAHAPHANVTQLCRSCTTAPRCCSKHRCRCTGGIQEPLGASTPPTHLPAPPNRCRLASRLGRASQRVAPRYRPMKPRPGADRIPAGETGPRPLSWCACAMAGPLVRRQPTPHFFEAGICPVDPPAGDERYCLSEQPAVYPALRRAPRTASVPSTRSIIRAAGPRRRRTRATAPAPSALPPVRSGPPPTS